MTIKSCEACPSFVRAAETASVLGESFNSDVCVRFGHILSRPGAADSANERTLIKFAEACPSAGDERPRTFPSYVVAQVSMGDPVTISTAAVRPPRTDDEKPSSCTGCEYFIPASVVSRELGWSNGLCAMKGRLISSKRYVREAGACADGRRGAHRDTTDGILLMPQYDTTIASFVKVTGPTTAPVDRNKHRTDPRLYVTDKPLDSDDIALCIRAWRQVDDPEGFKEPVFLPIFDGEKLCGFDPRSTYGDHRPDLYVDHGGILYDLVCEMFEQGKTPILIGGAGVGKTEAAAWLAWLMDLPLDVLSMRNDTEVYEFIGETQLVEGETRFAPGRFLKSITRPRVTLIDEWNVSPEPVWHLMRPTLAGQSELHIDQAGGVKFQRHPFNFIMGAQNPSWDPIYTGVKTISAADLSRVTPVAVGLPPEGIERQIIMERCRDAGYDIDTLLIDKIMQVAADLRKQVDEGSLPISWGIRDNIDVALKTRYYSFEKAYRRGVTDGLEPQLADVILASVRSVA